MKKPITWTLIADGGRARIVTRREDGHGLGVVEGQTFEVDLPKSSDDGGDRPGRSYESVGNKRHAIEPRTDPHEERERHFLNSLATGLESHLKDKRFDHLVVAAPPKALGILRSAMPDKVRATIVAEVAKDFTKTPDHDLASLLPPESLK